MILNIEVTEAEAGLILAALSALPYRDVVTTMNKIIGTIHAANEAVMGVAAPPADVPPAGGARDRETRVMRQMRDSILEKG